MDGEITIGTTLSTDKFDRQIAQLEKKMKKEENKDITIQANISGLQQEINRYEDLRKEVENYRNEISKLEAIKAGAKERGMPLRPSEFLPAYQDAKDSYMRANSILQEQEAKINSIKNRVIELNAKHEEINSNISEYKQKIESIKMQQHVAQVDEMKNKFKGVGSTIQDAIGKVARLALGIFALRSAYMAVRQASSTLASYDKQYAANIEYIRYALAQAIAPVLRYIVNLAATLLGYINAILNAWFGINLFGKASAKDFQKMKVGASGAAKAAKEIRKQLAGFDEINMLSDQSDSGGGGGGGAGGAMPNFDLSALNGDVPEWLRWIIENKDLIFAVMAGIAAGLLAWKFGLDGIRALGIGVLVAGLVYAFQALVAYIKDPTWSNFGKLVTGIGTAIAGVGIIIAKVAGIAAGLPVIVVGIVIAIVGIIIKYWNEIQAFLQKGIDWLKDRADWIRNNLGDTIGNIYDLFVKNLQLILDWFDNTFKNMKNILDGLIQFVKGVFTGQWSMVWDGLKKIVGAVWDWIKNTIKTAFLLIVNIADQAINAVKGFFNLMWTGIKAGASAAWNFIKSIFGGIASWFGGVINNVINMFRNFGAKAGEVIGGAFRAAVNGVLRAIENILNSPIRAINSLINTINAVPGINLSRLNTFSLPRLASGGIVNMPNRGTMLGGAIVGESGREGVIPLTDSQAMAQLGEEIGKHVLVNLTNVTEMNGRVLAREIKQIQSEQNFAFNM